jgi:uncharacterized hydrophobic protein (TIGR00271 family)
MARVSGSDVERMADGLFIDGRWNGAKSSKFWILLVLAAVIATAGVIADSTATVIGAMIVAPLMTPILGTALAVVLADRRRLLLSVGYVVGGAAVVVAIGFLLGLAVNPADGFAANSQVSARISPRLIDLVAALATGTVGAFALVRADISDTLPGVAIAISLVPPLAVVGLLLEVHRYRDAAHAGLLFGTNVAAIVATGTAVLLAYRVRDAARASGYRVGELTGRTLVAIGALVVLVAVPLAAGSAAVASDQRLAASARPLVATWASSAGWQVATVEARGGVLVVTALGPPPQADPAALRTSLNEAGFASADLQIRLVIGGTRFCPTHGSTCEATTVTD